MAVQSRPCKRCRGEIPAERLEALPDTLICVKCSQEIGGEWEYRYSEVNTGKAGSLKKNYGGISVHKRRKPIERQD